MNLEGRTAVDTDIAQLAAMNQQLIHDSGHHNAMSTDELKDRMKKWLVGEYDVTIFTVNASTVGYALYKSECDWTYLRQFFILPELRRKGIGGTAMQWLFQNPWRDTPRIRIDVLIGNTEGIAFWRSIGFQDYCITMEMDALSQDQ